MRFVLIAGLVAGVCGCSPFGGATFTCTDDSQCTGGSDGTCQPSGFCSFADGSCASGQSYGALSGSLSNTCVGAAGDIDARIDDAIDASPDGLPISPCYGTGLVTVCLVTAPTLPVTLSAAIATGTAIAPGPMCAALGPDGNTDACVIAGTSITIQGGTTLVVTGARPVVFVSETTIDVGGTIDVASHRAGLVAGAGANSASCVAANSPTKVGGGGGGGGGGCGGSFGGKGGDGLSPTAGANGCAASPATPPVGLRGGCPGIDGATSAGSAGTGGGATYLIARQSITINGSINASGSAGGGGPSSSGNNNGGGGAGSGGMIGLDAPSITVAASGVIFANGGGGGEGSSSNNGGNSGAQGGESVLGAVAAGGSGQSSSGGNGGSGAAGPTLNGSNGAQRTNNPGGSGGGGGGAGVIKLHGVPTIAGTVSPPQS